MGRNMVGKYLRVLRKKYGISQKELALEMNVSKQTISNWEVGRKLPRMKAIEKLAKLYGVPKASIMAGRPIEELTDEVEAAAPQAQRVVDLSEQGLHLTYQGHLVPQEYIEIIEKLMRSDTAEHR
ncbi:helix-turn-helix transcriptional regulator [Lactobacillus delbrueckii]|uniref:helix-turn-helix transcriptional regulator n=1 Tax=Lactobacillus delbrueckii TaxID=1584 RepID=UPI001E382A34|nr:helix-turn-helix transcriptional regulator [Lactobacillus delbrueckii]MCD5542842.1 helix-turn-helix domain-containing protein [Lactobacillus delbrueckii subsp. lactis]